MDSLKKKSLAEFETLSRHYDSCAVSWFFRPFYKRIAKEVHSIPHRRILSVGCGTATLEVLLAKAHPASSVVGLDFSRGMLEKARTKAIDVKNIAFIEGDAEHLPLEAQSFDIVICSHSFHHYPNQMQALTEMNRVLTDDGVLILVDGLKASFLAKVWLFFVEHVLEPGVRHFSASALSAMFLKAGFSSRFEIEKMMIAYAIIKARR